MSPWLNHTRYHCYLVFNHRSKKNIGTQNLIEVNNSDEHNSWKSDMNGVSNKRTLLLLQNNFKPDLTMTRIPHKEVKSCKNQGTTLR